MSAATPSASPTPSMPIPIMKGGAREHVLDIIRKYTQPLEFYFGVLLFLGIVYVGQISPAVQHFANSLLGRITLFILTIIVADMYSWVYALLMAIFTVLLIAVAPRTLKEAFQVGGDSLSNNPDTEIKMVTQKQKWWIERALGEDPVGIEEEKVRTSSIQDNSNSSNSTTSSSGR
jgi:hypothetical protein